MVQDKDQLLYIEQYFGSIDRFMAYIIEEYKGRLEKVLSIRRRGNKENEVMDLDGFVTKLLKEIEEKEIF